MKYDIVYVVMCEGEVRYASTDKEPAEIYADNQMYNAREAVLDEWNNDEPTEEDIAEASFQAGGDVYYYEVVEVDISNQAESDTVELPNGDKIEVSDILKKLKICE